MAILNYTVENTTRKVGEVLRFVARDDSIVVVPGGDVEFDGITEDAFSIDAVSSIAIILDSDDGTTQSWRLPNKRDEWPYLSFSREITGDPYPLETLTSNAAGQWYLDDVAVEGNNSAEFEIPESLFTGQEIRQNDSNVITLLGSEWHWGASETLYGDAVAPSFTRSSIATRINSSGTMEQMSSNQLRYDHKYTP